jgi:hypothetical protein
MKRVRNDADGYRRGARGIDMDKGGRFTKSGVTSHLGQDATVADFPERAPYSRNAKLSVGDQWTERATEQPLRQVEDFQFRAKTRDIWGSAIEGNGEVNGGFSGPIKYGTDLDN